MALDMLTRRRFVKGATVTGGGLAMGGPLSALTARTAEAKRADRAAGYGPLSPTPEEDSGRAYLALGSFGTVGAGLGLVFARRPAFGSLDAPVPGPVARGASVTVSGWALASEDLANVIVELDGTPVATVPLSTARPDVCTVYPGYPGCPAVGFSGSVSLAGVNPACAHVMKVVAVTSAGVRTVLGERLVQP